MQKWFLMKARSVSQVECCIDLSGLGGAHQEFGQFGWFHIEDMLPLCRDFKRGAYAYVIRAIQPPIAAGQASLASPLADIPATETFVEKPGSDQSGVEHSGVTTSAEARTVATAVRQHALDDIVAALVQIHGEAAIEKAINAIRERRSSEQKTHKEAKDAPNDLLQEVCQSDEPTLQLELKSPPAQEETGPGLASPEHNVEAYE